MLRLYAKIIPGIKWILFWTTQPGIFKMKMEYFKPNERLR